MSYRDPEDEPRIVDWGERWQRPTATVGLLVCLVGCGLRPAEVSAQQEPGTLSVAETLGADPASAEGLRVPVQESRSGNLIEGAFIGAAAGGLAGLLVFELAADDLLCDADDDPDCEVSPTRLETVLIGAGLGAVVGAIIGSRVSNEARAYVPRVLPYRNGGAAFAFRIAPAGG